MIKINVNERPIPTVYHERPRCPTCRAPDMKVRKTCPQGDGSRLRYCTCHQCGARFKVVIE